MNGVKNYTKIFLDYNLNHLTRSVFPILVSWCPLTSYCLFLSQKNPKTNMIVYLFKYLISYPSPKSHSFIKYSSLSLNQGIKLGKFSVKAIYTTHCAKAAIFIFTSTVVDLVLALLSDGYVGAVPLEAGGGRTGPCWTAYTFQ